jgi:uncharacterized protein YndB with AHSA1/START domain
MPHIEASTVIARPVEDVFAYLIDPGKLPVWDSSIVSAESTGDPMTVGNQTHGVSKVLGHRFEWTTELTEISMPRRAVYASIAGPMQFTVTNTFESVPEGTKYTYAVDAESGLGGVFGKLADPVIAKAQTHTIRANLATLTDLLDAELVS